MKRLKYKNLFLSCAVLVVAFFILGSTEIRAVDFTRAVSSEEVADITFLSAFHIRLRSNGQNYHFTLDSNPFERSEKRFILNTDCPNSVITIPENVYFSQGGMSGVIKFQSHVKGTVDGSTVCINNNEREIRVSNKDSGELRFVSAFKLDDDNVYMPQYRESRGCATGGTTRRNGIFRRFPSDALGYNVNRYIKLDNGTSFSLPQTEDVVTKNRNGEYLDTSESKQYTLSSCVRLGVETGARPGSKSVGIRVAGLDRMSDYYRTFLTNEFNINFNEDGTISAPEAGAQEDNSCESKGGPFGWILCFIVDDLILKPLDMFAGWVENRLEIDLNERGAENAFKGAWSNIRNLANILFVLALLAIIISQTIVGRF